MSGIGLLVNSFPVKRQVVGSILLKNFFLVQTYHLLGEFATVLIYGQSALFPNAYFYETFIEKIILSYSCEGIDPMSSSKKTCLIC